VAEAFQSNGHLVRGLVRSEEKAKLLLKAGIEPVIGDLSQPNSYRQAIEQAEVIVHCGMDGSEQALEIETLFVDTVLSYSSPKNLQTKAFIYTSGVWVIGNTGPYIADESSLLYPLELVRWREAMEQKVLEASAGQFSSAVLRPGCVYGGAGSLTALWFSSTLRGSVEIVGDGDNHWAMVHQRDLARAYVSAAEQELNGVILNIVDNSHFSVLEMAQAIAKAANIPGKIEHLSRADAAQKYGSLVDGLLVDQHISNERALRLLGWLPQHRNFVDGIAQYYMAWKAAQQNL
jgi:nucleoside-diphosphate-sugar epimerase